MHGWGMYGWGWLGMIISLLVGLAILVGIIWLIVWLVRRSTGSQPGYYSANPSSHSTAKEILQQRYARGELTREQYQEMLSDLDR